MQLLLHTTCVACVLLVMLLARGLHVAYVVMGVT